MTAKNASNGWDRIEVNVRLSKPRLAQLRQIASALPPEATPTDAIDLALAEVLQKPAVAMDSRLDELEDAIEAHAMESRFDLARLEAAIAAMAASLESLKKLISDVAASDEY